MTKRAKPAIKSSTLWGGLILFLTVALPILSEKLARMESSPAVEWVQIIVAMVAAFLVFRGRTGEPAPVRGLFRVKGSK